MEPNLDEEILRYIEIKNELKEYYLKAANLDIEYAKNFPSNSTISDRIEYNKKYNKELIELGKEHKLINEKLNESEEILVEFGFKIHYYEKPLQQNF